MRSGAAVNRTAHDKKREMLLLNYLQHESFILWKSRYLYLTSNSGGGLLLNPGMTDCLERSRVLPDVRIGFLSINEQKLNYPCFTGG